MKSLDFLVAVKDFVAALNTSTATDGNTDFDTFMEIVDKFIICNSPCEVNIDSDARDKILTKAAAFKELSLVSAVDRPTLVTSTLAACSWVRSRLSQVRGFSQTISL